MIYSLASLSFPGFLSYIVDDGIMVHDANKMIFYCVAMSVTGIVMIVFQYMEQISFYKLAQEITDALKEKIYHVLTKKILISGQNIRQAICLRYWKAMWKDWKI